MIRQTLWIAPFCTLLILAAAVSAADQAPPATQPDGILDKGPLLIHLPGIGGHRLTDDRMTAGLADAHLDARIVIYDWTESDPGLHALTDIDRNKKEAQIITDMIVAHHKVDPGSAIFITAHSGGCALAVWALEKLPDDLQVDQVLLLAPALSPGYDLSTALSHVRGQVHAFTSLRDIIVLKTGTTLFGTMDNVDGPAAGYSGFVQPPDADADQYKKLIPHPYDPAWLKYGDRGDHIGVMSRPFAGAILAPLLKPAPVVQAAPATRPQVAAH